MTLLYTNVFFFSFYTEDGSHQNISVNKIYAYIMYILIYKMFFFLRERCNKF